MPANSQSSAQTVDQAKKPSSLGNWLAIGAVLLGIFSLLAALLWYQLGATLGSAASAIDQPKVLRYSAEQSPVAIPPGAPLAQAGALLQQISGKIAILGDSYSSGEGSFHYAPSAGWCHRSPGTTYVDQIFKDSGHPVVNLACSGAVIADLYQPQYGRTVAAQLAQLRINSDIGAVFLTLGGNDIGFFNVLVECLDPRRNCVISDSPGSAPAMAAAFQKLHLLAAANNDQQARLPGLDKLGKAYLSISQLVNSPQAIAARGGKLAPIIVSGYPMMFPKSGQQCSGAGGQWYSEVNVLLDQAELEQGWKLMTQLNDVIAKTVEDTRNRFQIPVYYVDDLTDLANPGHSLCEAKSSYFNGLAQLSAAVADGGISQLYHPNLAGHQAWAQHIIEWSKGKEFPQLGAPDNSWQVRSYQRLNIGLFQSDHQLTIAAPQLAGDEPESTLSVWNHDRLAIKAEQLAPFSELNLYLPSKQSWLGTWHADGSGRAAIDFALAGQLPPGADALECYGINQDGNQFIFKLSLDVQPAPSATGITLGVFGLVLLLAGVVLLIRRVVTRAKKTAAESGD